MFVSVLYTQPNMLTQDRTLIAAVFAADDASRLLCFQKAAVFTADYAASNR